MHGKDQPINLLVVEDNEGDLLLLTTYLEKSTLNNSVVHHAAALSRAKTFLPSAIDVIFLDLTLPDSTGLASFTALNRWFPNIPIIVLSGILDEQIAIECIALGAQDYLIKNELNERWLVKSVHYSIERKKNLADLKKINEQYELIGSVSDETIWTWMPDKKELRIAKKVFLDYKEEEISHDVEWWFQRIHTDDQDLIAQAMKEVIEGRKQHFHQEYKVRRADGSYRCIFARGVLLKEPGDERRMIGSMSDVTEIRRLHNELAETQLNLQKQINEATILGQEREKEEIGRELHDNVNQVLTSIKLYLDLAIIDAEMKDRLLDKCRANITVAINEIRRISHTLIPPSLGEHRLMEAVKDLVDEMNATGSFKTHLNINDFDESLLDDKKKLMLYRILQEQMNNIVKYSKANAVFISFEMQNGKLHLTIADNGVGFNPAKKVKGIGLRNVANRVSFYSGEMFIKAAEGEGTALQILLPV